jgi:hypothetical protein
VGPLLSRWWRDPPENPECSASKAETRAYQHLNHVKRVFLDLEEIGIKVLADPEPVKIVETGIGHIVCMTAGGWLIQAAPGMRGGTGRLRNRSGLTA